MRSPSALLAFGLFGFSAYAADTATLSGIVRDPSDAAIVGAQVTILDQSTAASRRTSTNGSGLFTAPSLQPGTYSIKIVAQGFKAVESKDVRLGVAEVKQLDFTLEVGEVSQSVTVEGGAPMINATDGSVGMTVDRKLVDNLPLNGRTFQQLITQAPGINLAPASSTAGQFTVNGQRATANYLTIDGASGNIRMALSMGGGTSFPGNAAGGTNSLVSIDSIEEFRILTSSYAPEYGRSPGGQVIIRTRSGTNQFHGGLSEYFRNDVLDANDWFANANGKSHPPLRFNDFGGVLGGPIILERTFFFFSYEGQQIRQPQFILTAVPSLSARQSATLASQPILNAFPLPNGPDIGNGQAQLAAGYSNPLATNATGIRLDHTFGAKLVAFARYSDAPSNSRVRGPSGYSLSTLQAQAYGIQTLTTGLTYLHNSRIVNDLRLNVSQASSHANFLLDGFLGAAPLSNTIAFPAPLSATESLFFASLGFASLSVGKSISYEQRQINITDGVDFTASAHHFKFGFDYRRLMPLGSPYISINYIFSGVPSVISNSPSSFTLLSDANTRGVLNNVSTYIQDTWRITHKLTATYGVRWEVNTPPRSLRPNNGNYFPLRGNYSDPSSVVVGKVGSALWETKYHNFAPRIGLAYRLRDTQGWSTILRAGAGLFYDLGYGYSVIAPWLNGFPNALNLSQTRIAFPISSGQATLPVVDFNNPPSGATFYTYPADLALPRTWQWNTAIQQSMGRAQTLTVSYVAALGRKLLYEQLFSNVGPKSLRVDYTSNEGASNYQSLQLAYQWLMSKGLSMTAAYTWAHSIDNLSNDQSGLIPPTTRLSADDNRGPSDFDIRHNLSGSLSYDVPAIGRLSWLRAVTSDWGIDSIFTARSANPVNVSATANIGFGSYLFRPDVVSGVPLYVSDPHVGGGRRFNKAAFAILTTRQGNLGRNSLRGFDLGQVDLSVRRTLRITEHLRLLLRGDVFNVLNHPNFADPLYLLNSGVFGISSAMFNNTTINSNGGVGLNSLFQLGGPRSVQLSLKLQF